MNQAAVDAAIAQLKQIEIPAAWRTLETGVVSPDPEAKRNSTSKWKFIEEVAKPMLALEGDRLPVSVFQPGEP